MTGHRPFTELTNNIPPERRARIAVKAAKLEKRGDMHVSNLRRYIEALGGTLEITARFGDARVVVDTAGRPAAGA